MERPKGYYSTFVVKVWCDETEGVMRGYIQHVSTQEHTYFLSLENMTDFIVSHLGPPPSNSVTQGETEGERVHYVEGIGDIGRRE